MQASPSGNVLVVDDEPDITTVMKMGLGKLGHEVDVFNDPITALSQFKPDYYDVIILDLRMTPMTGFELAREILKQDKNARVCFYSAFEVNQDEVKSAFADFNAHCVLKKPIMPSELAKHIEEHLLKEK